ncbi:MAG: glycosyltransferase [Myxococcota bacterium]|jgi:glycosyltransferase involved in cell wall biosynthesis|nr:glycosyltransferase [Myxococcota bacterium]
MGFEKLKVALVHDWLVSQRGGEHVLLEIANFFPNAPIFTLVHQPGSVAPQLESHPIYTSFIQNLPGAPQRFRPYLGLFPKAIEAFDLSAYDLIVSTSHCVAKGVKVRQGQKHLSYIHTPMRYIWDQMPHYLPSCPGKEFLDEVAHLLTTPLRSWDVRSAQRPSQLIANSEFVAQRIRKYWQRDADVIHPPVDTTYYAGDSGKKERSGFLVVSALVAYKSVALAVDWATTYGEHLRVFGQGPELERLKARAGPHVDFVQGASKEDLAEAYQSAEALLFCGVEDFGIVPVEAMASGCPVVAFNRGGCRETVVGDGAGCTGVFFDRPHIESLQGALVELRRRRLQTGVLAPEGLKDHAERFSRRVFVERMQEALQRVVAS